MDDPNLTAPSPLARLRQAYDAVRLWLILLLGVAGTIAALSLPINTPGPGVRPGTW